MNVTPPKPERSAEPVFIDVDVQPVALSGNEARRPRLIEPVGRYRYHRMIPSGLIICTRNDDDD